MIKINIQNIVTAKLVEGWSMSLLGRPKLTIICGNCNSQFKTRDYQDLHVDNKHIGSIACCQFCGKWNKFNLIYD